MDKETIRTVALEKYNDSEFRIPNVYCFIEGAEWLQSQPLSERLTEAEKEMIRNYHRTLSNDKHIAIYKRSYSGQAATTALLFSLEQIFGDDLFTDKTKNPEWCENEL